MIIQNSAELKRGREPQRGSCRSSRHLAVGPAMGGTADSNDARSCVARAKERLVK